MTHTLRRIVGLCFLGLVTGATGPALAEDATTTDLSTQPHLKSWSNVIPNAARRFVVLSDFNNHAVLDRETGLVWEKSPATTFHTWNDARYLCIVDKNVGGRKSWRLPSVFELASLIDPNVTQGPPTLPPGHPFLHVQSAVYWSETTNAHNPDAAWYANFQDATVFDLTKTDIANVWCVHGPMHQSVY